MSEKNADDLRRGKKMLGALACDRIVSSLWRAGV